MRTLLLLCGLFMVSCASAPSARAAAMADVGPQPSREACEYEVRAHFQATLKDPMSAVIQFGSMGKAWYMTSRFSQPKFAWRLDVSCNAKNSYGGYTGAKDYLFYFIGINIVAIGQTETIYGSYGSNDLLVVVESNGGGRTAEQAGVQGL